MSEWMRSLAEHYEEKRNLYPDDRLMILFDIDGAILDTRSMMLYALQSYDTHHQSSFFLNLNIEDITVHETEVREILTYLDVPEMHVEAVVKWYREKFWSNESIIEAYRPFAGVMDVIRWFQLQPGTFIGLNTGRPEQFRNETLVSLNRAGLEFHAVFADDFLYMNSCGWNGDVTTSKVAGVRHFQSLGYHIFAFIDNEPDNLEAVTRIDPSGEILLLHADTIYKSKGESVPKGAVSGSYYDVRPLLKKKFIGGQRLYA
jgi:Predicted phosphatases